MPLREKFEDKVRRLLPSGERAVLAVSGGRDSMCMADLFVRCGIPAVVANCNFHLRGEESDGDSAMVEKWCAERGVPFFRKDFDTIALASEKGLSVEMAARELRYSWFDSLCREQNLRFTAVAHNANDNAETLILNMLRGSGVKGMAGMRESSTLPVPGSQVLLIRPLLSFSRAEIDAYVTRCAVPYRDDSTNAGVEYRRNRVRHLVFPVFESLNPSFIDSLGRDMDNLRQVEEIADSFFAEVRPSLVRVETSDEIRVDADVLRRTLHRNYVIHRLMEPLGFTSADVRSVAALFDGSGNFSGKTFMSPSWTLVTSASELIFLGRQTVRQAEIREGEGCMTVEGPGEYEFNGRRFSVSLIDRSDLVSLRQPAGVTVADASALQIPFLVRGWRHGDWMRPMGAHGRKKLSDIFTDLKFSIPDKDRALVAVVPSMNPPDAESGIRVAALIGYRVDESVKVESGTGRVVKISLLASGGNGK